MENKQKKLNINSSYDLQLQYAIYTQEKYKKLFKHRLLHECSIALFTVSKNWKQSKFPHMNGLKKCSISIWNTVGQ